MSEHDAQSPQSPQHAGDISDRAHAAFLARDTDANRGSRGNSKTRGSPRKEPEEQQLSHSTAHDNNRGAPSEDSDSLLAQDHLRRLDEVIMMMDDTETAAYRIACDRNSIIRTDPRLRLKFLRVERFHVGLAAHRFIQYFDMTREFFGDSVGGKQISMSDLSRGERAALFSGGIQLLPMRAAVSTQDDAVQTDDATPFIIFVHGPTTHQFATNHMLRALVYFIDCVSRADGAPRRGVVWVHYESKSLTNDEFDVRLFMKLQRFLRFAAPIHVKAMHLVHDDLVLLDSVAYLYETALSPQQKVTFKVHLATSPEYKSRLKDHHIDSASFPMTDDGNIIREHHLEWIQRQYRDETGTDRSEVAATQGTMTHAATHSATKSAAEAM